MEAVTRDYPYEKELTLKEYFDAFLRLKWLVTGIMTVFVGCTVVAILMAPKIYRASVVIAPVTDAGTDRLGGLGSLASQFGGLASLAGLSISSDSKKSEALAVLQSGALTEQYIKEQNLLPVLFHRQWDLKKKTGLIRIR